WPFNRKTGGDGPPVADRVFCGFVNVVPRLQHRRLASSTQDTREAENARAEIQDLAGNWWPGDTDRRTGGCTPVRSGDVVAARRQRESRWTFKRNIWNTGGEQLPLAEHVFCGLVNVVHHISCNRRATLSHHCVQLECRHGRWRGCWVRL